MLSNYSYKSTMLYFLGRFHFLRIIVKEIQAYSRIASYHEMGECFMCH